MAETSRYERRRHFRGKPRPGRRLPVRWRLSGPWIPAETRNIGVGGAFIATPQPLEIGEEIAVELHIPTCDRTFEVRAQVRWCQPKAGLGPGEDAGMGVQFIGVDIDVLLELNDYFASLTGADVAAG